MKYKQKELLGGIPLVELKKENALMEKKAEKNIIFNKPLNSRNTLNPNHFFSINKELDKEYKYDNNLFIKSLFEGETYRFPYHNKTNLTGFPIFILVSNGMMEYVNTRLGLEILGELLKNDAQANK